MLPPSSKKNFVRKAVVEQPSLGAFLRAHRERIDPKNFGFGIGRRRTPGLRREELAQLCRISPTWYTWIEQNRPVTTTPETLARIADCLQLSRAERAYLFELANMHDPNSRQSITPALPSALSNLVKTTRYPAYALDRQWNVVLWNTAAKKLFGSWLTKKETPNLLRYIFLSKQARTFVVEWEHRARRVVAEFRADSIRYVNEAPTQAFIQELSERSASFRRFWQAQDVIEREGGLREFQLSNKECLAFDQITLKPTAHEDLKMVVLIPLAQRASE